MIQCQVKWRHARYTHTNRERVQGRDKSSRSTIYNYIYINKDLKLKTMSQWLRNLQIMFLVRGKTYLSVSIEVQRTVLSLGKTLLSFPPPPTQPSHTWMSDRGSEWFTSQSHRLQARDARVSKRCPHPCAWRDTKMPFVSIYSTRSPAQRWPACHVSNLPYPERNLQRTSIFQLSI